MGKSRNSHYDDLDHEAREIQEETRKKWFEQDSNVLFDKRHRRERIGEEDANVSIPQ